MTQIELIQKPIIRHSLVEIGKSVTERLAALNIENQVATEETVTALKKMRAELNKEAAIFDEQRKSVKQAILIHYNEFEIIYKVEISEKFAKADETLRTKIRDFEAKIKEQKRDNLKEFFNELTEHDNIGWLTFDRWNVEINLSTTEKKYKEIIFDFVGKIVEDLDLINTEEHAAEIIVEYKKTLKASQAITMVRQRKAQEKIEKERIIFQRTKGRVTQLLKIAFVYSDIANAYYFVKDNTFSISLNDVETLDNDQWNKRYAALEEATKDTEILRPPTVGTTVGATVTVAQNAQNDNAQNDNQTVAQEIHQAKFCVQGTMSDLMKLKEFLTSNNYKYHNI